MITWRLIANLHRIRVQTARGESGGRRRLYHICPIDSLELEPLCKVDSVCPSMLEGIRAKRDRAATFIGHQGWDLKAVNWDCVSLA